MMTKLIIALDTDCDNQAFDWIANLSTEDITLKVGLALFTSQGYFFVEKLIEKGFSVFLDLKFHDIPNTVKDACRIAASMGVHILNVHALGGLNMMIAAKEGIDKANVPSPPKLIAVTLLTSMSEDEFQQLKINDELANYAVYLASQAKNAGLDGVVCSAFDTPLIKTTLGKDFLSVTPGIRFEHDRSDDQVRIVTPMMAKELGADYIVMGRSLTQHSTYSFEQSVNSVLSMLG